MLPSKATHATGLKGSRININRDRDTQPRNVEKNIGTKRRKAFKKAAAPASSLESRLEKARRVAFNLLGGED